MHKFIYTIFFSSLIAIQTVLCYADTVAHGYSPFGKLKYAENFEHLDYVNPHAPKGGKLRLASRSNFNSLNPFLLKGVAEENIGMIFDTLLVSTSDEPSSQYGLVAESLQIADDRSYVIFNIRKEARFHDGSPITADDLVFTLDILKAKANPNYKLVVSEVIKAEAISAQQVKYYLSNPDNLLIISIIGELPILSKKFFEGKDFEKFSEESILGCGPYKVKEYKFGKYIVYERVKDYWAKDLPIIKGHYNFDLIETQVYLDETVAVEAFKAAEYDFRVENISRVWANDYNIKQVREGKIRKVEQGHKNPANLQFYALNMRRPDFNDINFRKALGYAYDFDWMNKFLFYGIYKRTQSYFENSVFKATGIPEGKELQILEQYRGKVPEEVFTKEYSCPGTGADPMKSRENLRSAKELLLKAGYKYEGARLISPYTNKPVEIEFISYLSANERIFNKAARDLAKIGITAKTKTIDYAQFQKRMNDFDFDITTAAFAAISVPGENHKQFWHSASSGPGGLNYSGINDPVVDELIEGLINSKTMEEKIIYSRALDRVLSWNYYNILQMYSSNYRHLYWDKFGIPDKKPDYEIGIYTWWAKN